MRTRSFKRNKVNVITLGCSKNIFDSEVLMGQLRANNFAVSHEEHNSDAPVVIINTCGFIDNAKQESINTILEYAEAKKNGFVEKVYVTGCLSERYRPDLQKEIPDIDGYFGTHELPSLLKTLNADYKHELLGERVLTTPVHYAYFKISEGCDRPCSFCAIPLMRGKHISVPVEELQKRALSLARNGTRELILIAQDLTYYGLDIYGKRMLAGMLEMLSDIKGIDWIRLHYAFPSGFPLEVLDVIRERPNICKYLDIPLQHINNRILRSMRRGTSKKDIIGLIDTIREKVPGIAVRTTLMTGYPGETEDEFEEMMEWAAETRFDRLGVFAYSHEENTHSFGLKDDVPARTKMKRANEIMKLQKGISLELNRKKVGKILRVLIDRKDGELLIGRTEFDSPEVDNEVHVRAETSGIKPGSFADVMITGAKEYDLTGEIKG